MCWDHKYSFKNPLANVHGEGKWTICRCIYPICTIPREKNEELPSLCLIYRRVSMQHFAVIGFDCAKAVLMNKTKQKG